jgi:hypothetical protein
MYVLASINYSTHVQYVQYCTTTHSQPEITHVPFVIFVVAM